MDPLARSDAIGRYRNLRCDVWTDGRWKSLDTVPASPVFILSAWNPDGVVAPDDENARHDRQLFQHLERAGIQPQRVRGRGPGGAEEGWMIPYERQMALALLVKFRQAAGIVWTERGRKLLYADGLMSSLDDDRCVIPEVDPV